MTITRLIGDVHGKYLQYKALIKNSPPSIQVGDMGLGFRFGYGPKEGQFTQNPPHKLMVENNARFIRGNHDNPGECKKNSQWILDGSVEGDVMFIGGAESVDQEYRVKDFSWWEDEQLSAEELGDIVQKFIETKPRTVISHDCPEEVCGIVSNFAHRDKPVSRTQQALQAMWNGHSPDLWVFGHWHTSCKMDLDKGKQTTKFICLNELEYLDLHI